MKAKIIALSFVVIGGCAIEPTSVVGSDGKQRYMMNCHSGIDKCHQKAAELCPSDYDIIEHTKKSSIVVPHYGEYPMTIYTENLTVECK